MKRNKKKRSIVPKVLILVFLIICIAVEVVLIKNASKARTNAAENSETPSEPSTSDSADTPDASVDGEAELTPEEQEAILKAKIAAAGAKGFYAYGRYTYLSGVSGESGVPEEAQAVLVEFLDDFYRSQGHIPRDLTDSEVAESIPDMRSFFASDSVAQAEIWQMSLRYIITAKAMDPNDLNFTSSMYSIEYTDVTSDENSVSISFLESNDINFACLGDISSRTIGLECTAELVKEGGEWKISSYYREEDFFLAINREYEEGMTTSEIDAFGDAAIEKYRQNLETMLADRDAFNSGGVSDYMTADNAYDRAAALEYAMTYVDKRNSEWMSYDGRGGNCQNFASQVLYAGGIPMDTVGDDVWKFYSDTPDNTTSSSGRSASWTGADYFHTYAKNNTGFGLCASVDANMFSAEPGDIFQVGAYSGQMGHTNVIVGSYVSDGQTVEILYNSNSNNRINWPLTGTYSAELSLVKIYGYNN